MALNSFTSNQGTQTPILTDNTGGTAGTVIAVQKVDISGQGTAGTLWNGGVTGTINSGSINMVAGTVNAGTINTGTFVMPSGTLTVLPNLPQGSINVTAGTIATLGTMGTLGLVNTVTTVSNVSAGSINVVAGTIATLGTMGTLGLVNTVTTVSNLTNGSVNIPNGTLQALGTMGTLGTLANQGSLTNVGQLYNAGTVQNQLAGTITALQNGTIVGGTLQNLNYGTIAISDGTTKVNVMASGVSNGTGAQNAQFTAGAFTEILGTVSSAGADLLPSTDVSNYKWMSVQISGTFVGTINFNPSNDNVNFLSSAQPVQITSNTGITAGNITTNNIYILPLHARYMRVRMTTYTSGTAMMTAELYTTPAVQHPVSVAAAQNGAWNVSGTILAGTLGTITNLGQVYNAGTLQGGTINLGTFQQDPLPVRAVSTFGTHGTTGVSIFGTLAGGTGSGAGTEIFCTSVSFTIPSTGGSQDVSIGWGSNAGTFQAGTGLIVRGNFPPGGGIQKEFNPPINSGTNAQLMLFQAGAGTVDVSVSYFLAVSSL